MSKEVKLIPFPIAIHTLMLNKNTLHSLIKDMKIKTYKNINREECILEKDVKILCYNEKVKDISKTLLLKSLLSLESDKTKELLEQYRENIEVLEKIHNKYKNNVNILNDETALVAAYILFAKVINLLNMVCLCLENFYLNAGSLLRIIDETIDVAEYFIISEGTKKGDLNLKKWFREDVSPGNFICREELSKYMSSILQNEPKANEDTMKTIYYLKSKMIHPTRNVILESLLICSKEERVSSPNSFEYKGCSYPIRLYKLVEFFKSSIQTAFQGFFMCFHEKMPLEKEDKDILISFNDKYEKNT